MSVEKIYHEVVIEVRVFLNFACGSVIIARQCDLNEFKLNGIDIKVNSRSQLFQKLLQSIQIENLQAKQKKKQGSIPGISIPMQSILPKTPKRCCKTIQVMNEDQRWETN
jgi:hypothetical protein